MLTKNWTVERSDKAIYRRLLRRTMFPMLTMGILFLAIGIFGAWRVHRLHQRGSDILSENVSSIRAAEELEGVVHELRYRMKRYLSTRSQRHLEETALLIPVGRECLDQSEQLAKTGREQQLIQKIRRSYAQLTADYERVAAEPTDEASFQIAGNLADEIIPNEIIANTQRYIERNEEELANSRERNQTTATQLMFGLLMLGTCGGVIGLLAGYIIARRVSRTIVQLSLPIRDTAGKLDKVVSPMSVTADPSFEDLESILRMVSDRVTMVVERLQENEREMLRAEQLASLGQLAAGLAHELRNPLTSLKTILQLADTPTDLTPRDLDVLKQEIVRLEDSVQTFLDFARPPQPDKHFVEFDRLVGETLELVVRRAERQGVLLNCRLPRERIGVIADETQMRQVVLNLLLNALDAVPHGGKVDLEVVRELGSFAKGRSAKKEKTRAELVLRVSDNGPGLPPQLGEHVFDPFVSTKESGSGLGLSICKRILEAHEGDISATDRPEGGAVFTVRLPLPRDIPALEMEERHGQALSRR